MTATQAPAPKASKSTTAPKSPLAIRLDEFAQKVASLAIENEKQSKRLADAADASAQHTETLRKIENEELPFADGSKKLAAIDAEQQLLAFQISKRGTEIAGAFNTALSETLQIKMDVLDWLDRAEAAVVESVQEDCSKWLAGLGGSSVKITNPLPLKTIAQASPQIVQLEGLRQSLAAVKPDQPAREFVSQAASVIAVLETITCADCRKPVYGGISKNDKVVVSGWGGKEQRREVVGHFEDVAEARSYVMELRASTGFCGLHDIALHSSTQPEFVHSFDSLDAYETDRRAIQNFGSSPIDGCDPHSLAIVSAWTAAA